MTDIFGLLPEDWTRNPKYFDEILLNIAKQNIEGIIYIEYAYYGLLNDRSSAILISFSRVGSSPNPLYDSVGISWLWLTM